MFFPRGLGALGPQDPFPLRHEQRYRPHQLVVAQIHDHCVITQSHVRRGGLRIVLPATQRPDLMRGLLWHASGTPTPRGLDNEERPRSLTWALSQARMTPTSRGVSPRYGTPTSRSSWTSETPLYRRRRTRVSTFDQARDRCGRLRPGCVYCGSFVSKAVARKALRTAVRGSRSRLRRSLLVRRTAQRVCVGLIHMPVPVKP